MGHDKQRCSSDTEKDRDANASPALDDSGTGSKSRTCPLLFDPLWTPEQVAERLNTSIDWVHDHSSRKEPRLPVIRFGGGPGRSGLLRYRASAIEKFIAELEELSSRKTRKL
jgi:hypothetical protein